MAERELDRCPRLYIKGIFLVAGMVSGLLVYLIYSSATSDFTHLSETTDPSMIILTEHINEEDDYEKPVCKRLEESGERYDDQETMYYGEI